MAKYPWPQNVHPALVELVQRTCDGYALASTRCIAKPYFGHRSDDEQAALYAQGRQSLWDVNMLRGRAGLPPITAAENTRTVTNAGPGTSRHNDVPARAADLVIVSLENGTHYVWDAGLDLDKDGIAEYAELGEIGEKLGLIWGGRWKMKDYGHFELPDEGTPAMDAIYARLASDPAKAHNTEYDLTNEVWQQRQKMGIPS